VVVIEAARIKDMGKRSKWKGASLEEEVGRIATNLL